VDIDKRAATFSHDLGREATVAFKAILPDSGRSAEVSRRLRAPRPGRSQSPAGYRRWQGISACKARILVLKCVATVPTDRPQTRANAASMCRSLNPLVECSSHSGPTIYKSTTYERFCSCRLKSSIPTAVRCSAGRPARFCAGLRRIWAAVAASLHLPAWEYSAGKSTAPPRVEARETVKE
jgi:hypothetical protein